MNKDPEQTLLQEGHTEGPETYERMLSIASHQRDAKNHNVIQLHTSQNGHHKQINKQVLDPSALLVEMQTGAATVENRWNFI